MLNDFTGADRIYIACGYTDLHRGIDGVDIASTKDIGTTVTVTLPQSESYETVEKLSFSDNLCSDFANINSCALPRSSVNIANTDFIDRLKPTEVSASSFLSDMRVRNLY